MKNAFNRNLGMTMTTELTGLSILVTRPEEAGVELTHLLIEKGANALHVPVFSIVPISAPDYAKSLFNIKPNIIIATSTYAVKTAGSYISKHHKAWLDKVWAIGIGPATASALHSQGWRNVSFPKTYNSEGVLEMRKMTYVKQQTIVILTGAHGRNLLTPELISRGANLIQIDSYERRPQTKISPSAINLLAKEHALVVLTSVEAWQIMERLLSTHQPLLAHATLVVASKRIAEVIWQQHKHQRIIVAKGANHEAIIEAIVNEGR